jgi:hypothetical protein
MSEKDVADLDAVLTVLRKHGATEYTVLPHGDGWVVKLAPIVAPAPSAQAASPLGDLGPMLDRLDTVLRPQGAR